MRLSVLVVVLAVPGVCEAQGWLGNAWGFRKKLTADCTLIPSDQTNFPALVSFTSTDFRNTAAKPPPVFKSFQEAKVTGNNTSIQVTTPSGTAQNDLLIAVVVTDGGTAGSLAPPGGENWNQQDLTANGTAVTMGVWHKLAAASESASHTFTWSGNQEAYGFIMHFTRHDTTTPIDVVTSSTGSSTTPTAPTATTGTDNNLVLRIGGFDDDDITIDSTGLSASYTTITMDGSGTGANTSSGGAGYLVQATAGAPHGAPCWKLLRGSPSPGGPWRLRVLRRYQTRSRRP